MTDAIPSDDGARLDRFSWGPGDIEFIEEAEPSPGEKLAATLKSTRAQREAGNYKKGHVKFQGLDVSIECPAGSVRKGISKKDGHEWETEMHNAYGYIRRTEGEDGEHVDVYLGPDPEARYAYVVHQLHPDDGTYDEDKCMLGFDSEEDAKAAYLKHYDSPKFFGAITVVPMSLFKEKVLEDKGEPIVPDAKDHAESQVHKSLFNEDWYA